MSQSIYGEVKYNQAIYGGNALVEGVNYWYLEVQWDNSAWVAESMYIIQDSTNTERGRETKIAPSGEGFLEMQPGRMTVKLRNDTGRYDARNASSPLYPNVAPGKKIRLTYQKGFTGDRLSVFAGVVENIEPQTQGGIEIVTLTAADGLAQLQDEEANVTLTEGIKTGAAIEAVLDDISWSWGHNLDTGADTIPYWWVDQQKASYAIHDLTFSCLGEFFIGADGKANFYGRHHTNAVIVNLTGGDVRDPYVRQPWTVVKNIVRIKLHPRVLRALGEIWRLQDTLFIKAGESKTLWATYTYDNRNAPAKDVVCQATTDYTANAAENGSGADLTANWSVSLYSFGGTAKLIVSNTGGTDGYTTLLKLRGKAIDAPDELTVEDSSGSGNALFKTDMIWQQNVNTALDLAAFLAEQLSQDSFYPVITLEGDAEEQIGLELMDKINLVLDNYGISGDFKIGKIKHQVTGGGGGVVTTTLWLEPPIQDMSNYWTFPTELGVSSFFAY